MATSPASATTTRLLSNVPFNSDYKNTRWFDTVSEQATYFLAKPVVHSMAQANFQRIEGKQFIVADQNIDKLWGTNYLMFKNVDYSTKWFYAFVTKLEYINSRTTHVHFVIDVFQTWKFSMTFKPSYIVREHRRLWNTDGSPLINTVDEGLDYGSDYETVAVEHYQPLENLLFLVIVTKSAMHVKAEGSVENEVTPIINGVPQPLSYYIHPFRLDGSSPSVTIGASNINISSVLDALKSLATQDNAVNNIVSLYVTDYLGINGSYNAGAGTLTLNANQFEKADVVDNENLNLSTIYVKSIIDYTTTSKTYSNKYSDYHSVKESKLLMYPYTVLMLDDLKGNRTVLKNEYIEGNDINVVARGSMGTSNKVVYTVLDYLTKNGLDLMDKLHSSYEHAVINNNPNDIPVVTDLLSAFLQGNRNSIENQKSTLVFNDVMNVVGGAVGGATSAASGNIAGAASSATGIVQGMGNTVLALQGIQAKQKDINNTPPSLAKMGGNTNFDYGNRISGVYLIKKQIRGEYRTKLSHFFNMFGYKVNEVVVPNLHTRQHWNYIQTEACQITGNFNNEDLIELKSIFDNGITLWHTDDVGNYSLENGVL